MSLAFRGFLFVSAILYLLNCFQITFAVKVKNKSDFDYDYGDYSETGNTRVPNNEKPSGYLPLGSPCYPDDDDCSDNMICRKKTFLPGDIPVCQCASGYTPDETTNACRRLVQLGEKCSADKLKCAPEHSFCNLKTGACQCENDYKVGPNLDDCVWKWKTLFYGETCRNNVQCHYNLTCDDYTTCACPIGTRVDSRTKAKCFINELGDPCSNDDDCFRRDSVCSSGVCKCDQGFTPITTRIGTVDSPAQRICINNLLNSADRKKVGESCSMSYPFSQGICWPGLVCMAWKTGAICVDPNDNRPLPTTTPPPRSIFVPLPGDKCSSDDNCMVDDNSLKCSKWKKSFCRPRGDFCICNDGFFLNGSNCSPKPKSSVLGQACIIYKKNDTVGNCAVADSICAEGFCMCKHGFKPGPRGDDCVVNWKTQSFGEDCHDSVQCYYNMDCVNSTCSCIGVGQPDMSVLDQNGNKVIVGCGKVFIGDSCDDDDDCSGITNSKCSPRKKCICKYGFKNVTVHIGSSDDVTSWCLPESSELRLEGEECSYGQPEKDRTSGVPKITPKIGCDRDYYCSKCTDFPDRSVCLLRDVPSLATTRKITTTTKKMTTAKAQTTSKQPLMGRSNVNSRPSAETVSDSTTQSSTQVQTTKTDVTRAESTISTDTSKASSTVTTTDSVTTPPSIQQSSRLPMVAAIYLAQTTEQTVSNTSPPSSGLIVAFNDVKKLQASVYAGATGYFHTPDRLHAILIGSLAVTVLVAV